MEEQKFDSYKIIQSDSDVTKVKIVYSKRKVSNVIDESTDIFIREEEAERTMPIYLCDFDGFGLIEMDLPSDFHHDGIVRTRLNFGKQLFAEFYTNGEHFMGNMSPYDYECIMPKSPMKENGYPDLYDAIYLRMKYWNGDTANGMNEANYQTKREELKPMQTDKHKKDFLLGFVATMLKFEAVRTSVKGFVDQYMTDNPKYKYVRIFNKTF